MAAKETTINEQAIADALQGNPQVLAELTKHAKLLARKANATLEQRQSYPDYDVGTGQYVTTVFTRSNHAKHSNAIRQTLVKVVG